MHDRASGGQAGVGLQVAELRAARRWAGVGRFVWQCLVRLWLVLFAIFEVTNWTDVILEPELYDRLFRSEHACAIGWAYCSWGNYFLAQVPPSVLAIAAIVAMLWPRFPRRETALNCAALLAILYLAGLWITTYINVHWQ